MVIPWWVSWATCKTSFLLCLRVPARRCVAWVKSLYIYLQASNRSDGFPWVSNAHVLVDNKGDIVSCYRKVHLFDASSKIVGPNWRALRESNLMKPGTEILAPESTPIGKLGLGIVRKLFMFNWLPSCIGLILFLVYSATIFDFRSSAILSVSLVRMYSLSLLPSLSLPEQRIGSLSFELAPLRISAM